MATTVLDYRTASAGRSNLLLSNHFPDRFMAGPPRLDRQRTSGDAGAAHVLSSGSRPHWRILVSVTAEKVVAYTPIEAMQVAARALYAQHRHAIEAPVP
jgi:hypothetical protein